MSLTIHPFMLALLVAGSVFTLGASEALTLPNNGKQPRVAVEGERVAVAYADGEHILITVSTDSGTNFAAPVTVGSIPKLCVGMRRGPQVAMTTQSIVVAGIGSTDGNIVAWHSSDLGKTWTGPVTVNDVDKSAAEGLFSLTAGKDDAVWAVWLDLRDRVTQVEIAGSATGGATWKPNATFYISPEKSVCECCQPQIAADATGAIAVMWRNHIGDARDMWVSWSNNNAKSFNAPAKIGSGTWNINGCPMDGGGLAISGQTVETLWRREGNMFTCGPQQNQETALGSGKNGTLAIAQKGTYRAWQKGGNIVLATGDKKPVDVGPGTFPHLAADANSKDSPTMLVWESGSKIKLLRVDR